MKTVLLFGAGKSATVLIDYLLQNALAFNWKIIVVDGDIQLAKTKIGTFSNATAVSFDIRTETDREKYIMLADIVISLLPPSLHIEVAKTCIKCRKPLLTASYVDDEIKKAASDIEKNNLLFLYEMGLDPGIDHMSAMSLIDTIHEQAGSITSFKSHCGGLVAPESDNNPWHYKISWNPRNIVNAGKAGAKFLEHGKEKTLSYNELFSKTPTVQIPGLGVLSWYANRDSLSYISRYGLTGISTFIRSTLRHPDFINGWRNIIDLNLTDENICYDSNHKTVAAFFNEHINKYGLQKIATSLNNSSFINQLNFLGLNDNETLINKGNCSVADYLQFLMEAKLMLYPQDKDMIVMLHEIDFEKDGLQSSMNSSLIVKGEDSMRTAMAKTVGLPLGIAAKLILENRIKLSGLQIPTKKEIYVPVLNELATLGIKFHESVK